MRLTCYSRFGSRPVRHHGIFAFQTAIFWSAPTTRPTTRPTTQPTCQKRRRARSRVLSDFREQGLSGQVCSALRCPGVAHHTASSLLTAEIPTCAAADAPTALRQAWYVKSNSTTGLPPFGGQSTLSRPATDNQLSIAASSRRGSDPEWRNGVCAVRRLQQRRNTGRFYGPDQICRPGRYRKQHVSPATPPRRSRA